MWLPDFFSFNGADIYSLLYKFLIHIGIAVGVIALVAWCFMFFSKNKRHKELGLRNWQRYGLMWGIVAEMVVYLFIVIMTLYINPMFYFSTWDFSYYCGLILMLPEIMVFGGLITLFYVLISKNNKSI